MTAAPMPIPIPATAACDRPFDFVAPAALDVVALAATLLVVVGPDEVVADADAEVVAAEELDAVDGDVIAVLDVVGRKEVEEVLRTVWLAILVLEGVCAVEELAGEVAAAADVEAGDVDGAAAGVLGAAELPAFASS